MWESVAPPSPFGPKTKCPWIQAVPECDEGPLYLAWEGGNTLMIKYVAFGLIDLGLNPCSTCDLQQILDDASLIFLPCKIKLIMVPVSQGYGSD